MAKKKTKKKQVRTLKHSDAKRRHIPTAEYEPVLADLDKTAIQVAYEQRNQDLDPQLIWRGKDPAQDEDLMVNAPPIYIQEKVHPKVLVEELISQTEKATTAEESKEAGYVADLFSDFNGVPEEAQNTDFYEHDKNWTNRMVLGDALKAMTSMAEREGLRGQVQCIYMDPPYGIKFNSNFQWSTNSRDVKDGNVDHLTREPEQVKAFRDTWRDGIHSYLGYLRDRLLVSRALLNNTGSIFLQIGDENVHRVRVLLDEVFGEENFMSCINFRSMSPLGATNLTNVYDHILWYAKDKNQIKYRNVYQERKIEDEPEFKFGSDDAGFIYDLNRDSVANVNIKDLNIFKRSVLMSSGFTQSCFYKFQFEGEEVSAANKSWRTNSSGMERLIKANRLLRLGKSVYYRQYHEDFGLTNLENTWTDTAAGFSETKTYVVQTHPKVVQRCMLMTTDPGDLVMDPTCGSGTSAYVAEQWGRRWITIDTSRVALTLARSRLMAARFPYYLLRDSEQGITKESNLRGIHSSGVQASGNSINQGFVYQRKSRVYLKDIAHNSEIDLIWDKYKPRLDELLIKINDLAATTWRDWEVPREIGDDSREELRKLHNDWWDLRVDRQKEIDLSINLKSEFEYLYDKPFEDTSKVRVTGPFTVESLSPHRSLGLNENDDLVDPSKKHSETNIYQNFADMILENLKSSGVQQAHKENKIEFTSLSAWPGTLISADGRFLEEDDERRAGVFIGPEFGTVSRADLVEAAREAADCNFDVLIACAFNFDAHTTDLQSLGRVKVLKARMNVDLHMAEDLKNTGKGNLFVIFGEPDIDILEDQENRIKVKINGVDVFHPNSGEIRSDSTDGIACWFIDTDYNEESFFVRQAYFLGANDPYKSLKTTLKAEINQEAWDSLNSDISRPFKKPAGGRIAVKVINHLGDEVMKVYKVE